MVPEWIAGIHCRRAQGRPFSRVDVVNVYTN
jgi:hypothetical protein